MGFRVSFRLGPEKFPVTRVVHRVSSGSESEKGFYLQRVCRVSMIKGSTHGLHEVKIGPTSSAPEKLNKHIVAATRVKEMAVMIYTRL